MKYNLNEILRHCRVAMVACLLLVCALPMMAQDDISQVHGTVSDELGPLMGASVVEIDGNGRLINSALTDMNGNFTMKVKSTKNKIRFSFVGLKTQTLAINKTTYEIMMENATQLQEVVVKSKKRMNGNGLAIPEREVSFAKQSISTKEFEGLGINTIDEALQGRIAGLDIVGNSGNLGSGSTMRLRGSGSLSSLTDGNPLIVVDGNVREVDLSNFDVTSSNEEKFAELLNINTEDIASINVLKDGAATAIYGSQGGNGVIELITKRGTKSKPRVSYSLKLTGTYQPEGMKLLNGDDYTMLLKEAYFNPKQDNSASNIPEINYDPTFSEYNQYNDNTDWRDAVTQWGLRQNHYVTITGGGDRASFRISGGFDHETGTVIEQKMSRFSTRVNLDYNVSERIRVQTNFSMIYTKNNHNSDDLMAIALKKMPNMSIYEEDANGNDTDVYYNMIQSGPNMGSAVFEKDQRTYVNPVASAHLAKHVATRYDINPELVLNYELLGMDEDHHRLTWKAQVYMNVFNNYTDRFYPSELVTTRWENGHNTSYIYSSKSVSFTTKQTLTFTPSFKNKDHVLMAMGRFELGSGNSTWQATSGTGLPSGGIESPNAGGLVRDPGSGFSQSRYMFFTFSSHYSYKERYNLDFSLRADGTSKFGPGKRWGYFPAASFKWNIIDEPWMKKVKEDGTLSELGIRASWGIGGSAPNQNYLYTSKYGGGGTYLDMTSMIPLNLRLTNLQWEKVLNYNLGFDFDLFKNRLHASFEVYSATRSNMLMNNYRIPSNSGYSSVAFYNTGKLRNTGWEFMISTNKIIKTGKFSADFNVNFGNNRSNLLEMDETVLKSMNSTFNNDNGQVMTRVQLNNPLNAIYGFRSKGVYQYQYETVKRMPREEQQAFIDAGNTAPVALNKDGQIIRDEKGDPIRMMFNYENDGTGKNYKFCGGDAIYEDVNNDGQINALDMVYLGTSLPKLTGGFGFTLNYGNWRLSSQFTYRVGVDILNIARLNAEAMSGNNNQSQAVNYRWRKEGDITTIPRAMYGADTNFNTLISDRFVEDGSYLRCGYIQLSYAFMKKQLKALGFNKISLYASANNPFILTKYTGVDPDISASRYSPAQDWGQTPRARSYTFGMTIDF